MPLGELVWFLLYKYLHEVIIIAEYLSSSHRSIPLEVVVVPPHLNLHA